VTWTTDNLRETVTYWAPSGVDNTGDPSFATPVSIKAKWEDRTELFIDEAGREQRSRSVVYVDTDLIIGGYLFRGISTATDPLGVTNAFMIKDYKKVSDFENLVHERRAML
jgi:hypothetical protein